MEARRRPLDEVRYTDQINNTIAKATIEGKAKNTINNFKRRLRQLSRITDPMDLHALVGRRLFGIALSLSVIEN